MTTTHNIKLKQAAINFGNGFTVNGYQAGEGEDEFYFDTAELSNLLGFSANWIQSMNESKGPDWEAFKKLGYSHQPIRGYIEVGNGVKFVDAISISQFCLILSYASAFLHKEKAIELQKILFIKGFTDFIQWGGLQ